MTPRARMAQRWSSTRARRCLRARRRKKISSSYTTRSPTISGSSQTTGSQKPKGTGYDEVLVSEDGAAVYYEANGSIYRYETLTGMTSFVAAIHSPRAAGEAFYTTPDGQFLVFVGGSGGVEIAGRSGLELEPRGAAHNELYRYDAADGSVVCVSCGEGVAAPAEGEMIESTNVSLRLTMKRLRSFRCPKMAKGCSFRPTARLVPQDTNSAEANEGSAGAFPGMDVYEWEADGVEEGPGVVCGVVVGCTHLLTSGEDVGRATFLGAGENGRNVFFATAAQLVPQATPEFPNIYDARVEGGFPPRTEPVPCLSCQGVGSTAPLFGPGASLTFAGPGNPVASVATERVVSKPKSKPKRRHKKRIRAKRVRSHRGGGRS